MIRRDDSWKWQSWPINNFLFICTLSSPRNSKAHNLCIRDASSISVSTSSATICWRITDQSQCWFLVLKRLTEQWCWNGLLSSATDTPPLKMNNPQVGQFALLFIKKRLPLSKNWWQIHWSMGFPWTCHSFFELDIERSPSATITFCSLDPQTCSLTGRWKQKQVEFSISYSKSLTTEPWSKFGKSSLMMKRALICIMRN